VGLKFLGDIAKFIKLTTGGAQSNRGVAHGGTDGNGVEILAVLRKCGAIKVRQVAGFSACRPHSPLISAMPSPATTRSLCFIEKPAIRLCKLIAGSVSSWSGQVSLELLVDQGWSEQPRISSIHPPPPPSPAEHPHHPPSSITSGESSQARDSPGEESARLPLFLARAHSPPSHLHPPPLSAPPQCHHRSHSRDDKPRQGRAGDRGSVSHLAAVTVPTRSRASHSHALS